MNKPITLVLAVLAAGLLLTADADAKRLGGGRSFGAPRDTVTQRQAMPPAAAPTQPIAPTNSAAAPRTPAATPAAPPPPPQSGWRRFMGPIAGIAAGLGIAALLSHFGLSEAFGNFLVLLLVVVGVAFLVRLLFRRRAEPAQGIQYREPSMAGAGATAATRGPETVTFGGAAPAVSPQPVAYPPEFEPEPFLRQAKLNFARLQEAYDKGDTSTLRDVMTREMYDEVSRDLSARGTHHPTEIVTLNAEIVEVVQEPDAYWASVRFTGLLREDNSPTPAPFDEVWNLTKPANGSSGWLLAGIQQMQPA